MGLRPQSVSRDVDPASGVSAFLVMLRDGVQGSATICSAGSVKSLGPETAALRTRWSTCGRPPPERGLRGVGASWGYFSFQDLRQVSGFQRSLNPDVGLVRTMTLTRTAS